MKKMKLEVELNEKQKAARAETHPFAFTKWRCSEFSEPLSSRPLHSRNAVEPSGPLRAQYADLPLLQGPAVLPHESAWTVGADGSG